MALRGNCEGIRRESKPQVVVPVNNPLSFEHHISLTSYGLSSPHFVYLFYFPLDNIVLFWSYTPSSQIKMSGNVIKKAIPVGKIVKFGVEIACEVATETTEWTRPSDVAASHGPALKEAAEKSTKSLPPKTKKLISRCVLPKRLHSLSFRLTIVIVRATTKALGIRKTTSLLSHMMQMATGSKPFISTPQKSNHSLYSPT